MGVVRSRVGVEVDTPVVWKPEKYYCYLFDILGCDITTVQQQFSMCFIHIYIYISAVSLTRY